MKLRIQNNTIRVRLNDREIETIHGGKELNNQTIFPSSKLDFLLRTGELNNASFSDNKITITVNETAVSTWATSDEVAIAMEFDISNDKKLSILVEKDMKI